MLPVELIDKYYPEENELKHILLTHSRSVADKALWLPTITRNCLWIGIFCTKRLCCMI